MPERRLQFAGDGRPVETLDDELTGRTLEASAPGSVAKQGHNGVREFSRIVSQPRVFAVDDRQPLGADAG